MRDSFHQDEYFIFWNIVDSRYIIKVSTLNEKILDFSTAHLHDILSLPSSPLDLVLAVHRRLASPTAPQYNSSNKMVLGWPNIIS